MTLSLSQNLQHKVHDGEHTNSPRDAADKKIYLSQELRNYINEENEECKKDVVMKENNADKMFDMDSATLKHEEEEDTA